MQRRAAVVVATGSDEAVEFAAATMGSGVAALGVAKNTTIRMVSITSLSGGSAVGSDGTDSATTLSRVTFAAASAADWTLESFEYTNS